MLHVGTRRSIPASIPAAAIPASIRIGISIGGVRRLVAVNQQKQRDKPSPPCMVVLLAIAVPDLSDALV